MSSNNAERKYSNFLTITCIIFFVIILLLSSNRCDSQIVISNSVLTTTQGRVELSNCQRKYYHDNAVRRNKAHRTRFFDTIIYCNNLRIRTRLGKIKTLEHIPYFHMRIKINRKTHKRDYFHIKYYYPNNVTSFRMVWWSGTY
jgi:hypothetical protein